MCVAMNEERFNAVLVAQLDAWTRGDFADAGKFHGRESLFPCVVKFDCVFAGDCEEEFEIFAVGQGGLLDVELSPDCTRYSHT